MIRSLFKKLVPQHSTFFRLAFRLYSYRFWHPRKWKFDVLHKYAEQNTRINFIQIGSNNGITGDPLYQYIVKNSWHGVLVEPVPYLFEELKVNYQAHAGRLQFENSAIAEKAGSSEFYRLQKSDSDDLPVWYDQLGSFRKEVVLRHRNAIPHFDELLVQENVQTITFADLIGKYKIRKVNLVHIDAEGYDYEILKGIPFSSLDVEIVIFEYVHLPEKSYKEAVKLLRRSGFTCGLWEKDTIAIKNKLLGSAKKVV